MQIGNIFHMLSMAMNFIVCSLLLKVAKHQPGSTGS
jgi:hypothetical protein